jgi:hypothetical protein
MDFVHAVGQSLQVYPAGCVGEERLALVNRY